MTVFPSRFSSDIALLSVATASISRFVDGSSKTYTEGPIA